ncbi:hypothetical protein CEXT_111551 [Caerostris extrusa]|uniref:Uncharacterized protein n=1 Tax=Caerostris extrusa TaxID=172846 RepID=A0AAV4RW16_CAEEX|nr:hypothetical protein CEXT_111551 [Caerostris extrusa]
MLLSAVECMPSLLQLYCGEYNHHYRSLNLHSFQIHYFQSQNRIEFNVFISIAHKPNRHVSFSQTKPKGKRSHAWHYQKANRKLSGALDFARVAPNIPTSA